MPAHGVVAFADLRRPRPGSRPAPLAELGSTLPGAIADRLTRLLAQDPGLAEAVSAQLPAARAESVRDLAASMPAAPAPTIDLRG